MVVLQHSFFKEALKQKDKKKNVISIASNIAKLHGFTQNMPVNVRKIQQSELESVIRKGKGNSE